MVDLKKIELATEEDKAYDIDYWARIFKAKTWEEIKEMMKENEYLQEAAESLYVANADEIVRQQCRAREDAERRERTLERDNRMLKKQNEVLIQQDVQKTKQLAQREKTISELRKTLAERDVVIARMQEEHA